MREIQEGPGEAEVRPFLLKSDDAQDHGQLLRQRLPDGD